MTDDDLVNRFSYHKPPNYQVEVMHSKVRKNCLEFARYLNKLPDGRELSLAITHLEEVMFWSNAAIARGKYV